MARYIILICSVVMIFGCGGGGGGGGSSSGSSGGSTGGSSSGGNSGGGTGGTVTDPATDPGSLQTQPTKATVTLAAQGSLPQGTAIAGIGITVNLPPGVTVATDGSGAAAAGVITGYGQTTSTTITTVSSVVPATATAAGTLRMILASTDPAGFTVGQFARINCDISVGSYPKAADFSTTDFSAVDLKGVAITGLSPAFTAQIE